MLYIIEFDSPMYAANPFIALGFMESFTPFTKKKFGFWRYSTDDAIRARSKNALRKLVEAGLSPAAPYSRDCGTKAGHFRTARCCNGTNVTRSTADVGEDVLSTSSSAAAFNSVHRDNG